MKFQFQLFPIDQIKPWGQPGNRSLSWFALTYGAYCIDTPSVRLLEHTGTIDHSLDVPWCDYQVGRLFEDLVEMWPSVREPVPADIAKRYLAWEPTNWDRVKFSNDFDFLQIWEDASFWWNERRLDFSYLGAPPELHFWHSGSDVRLEWAAGAPWLPRSATLSVPFDVLSDAVAELFQDFLAAMAERVALIKRQKWQPTDYELDIEQLERVQDERENAAEWSLSSVRVTDWDFVRRQLKELGA